ncbi:hypothetical protein [Rubritalea tangerina]
MHQILPFKLSNVGFKQVYNLAPTLTQRVNITSIKLQINRLLRINHQN